MGNIILGIQLMLIGMVTVFAILMLVILGSRLLISLLNKFVPVETARKKAETAEIPIDILQQAVSRITGGKGHIVNVTKVSQMEV